MKVKTYDAEQERSVLASMVTDSVLLAHIAGKWVAPGLFASIYANMVGGWAVTHYLKYAVAPGSSVGVYYSDWAVNAEPELAASIATFLEYLSETAEPLGTEYALDKADQLFARVSVSNLVREAQAALDVNRPLRALEIVEGWKKPVIRQATGVNLLEDKEALRQAFEKSLEPVIAYNGAVGQFFGGQLARDSFIALLAPEKRGKTFMLMELAWVAAQQGNRVAYFSVGDMSEAQCYRRFMTRAAKKPAKPKTCKIPISLKIEKQEAIWVAEVDYKELVFDSGLRWEEAWKKCEAISGSGKKNRIKLHTTPAGVTKVKDIASVIDGWGLEGWVPDVVIIDYADILAAPTGYSPGDRSVHNAIWEQLRSLSQTLHCCLITATQADAEGGTSYLLTKKNFTEDKRKLAHCTGMIGLNQTLHEKRQDIMRLNWVILREEEYDETRCCYVAGCRSLASPIIKHAWASHTNEPEN